ncbi:chromosomal replication initiator DnaA [Rhodoligotrophos defluvii]|uniref:chromosomal replication initiator DnaA n=1 Tax=Rhodoligotrophos defluvii TaxID=2561934 RepID=UPI0010C998E9|nr:chromosomal replication initiator DnaA [Rhodoligotrophos defluvii]
MSNRAESAERPAQLAFRLPIRPAMGRDDFLVAPSNQAAVNAIDRWPHWRSRVLVLVGPEGSGKSHLARVWQATAKAALIPSPELSQEAVPLLVASGAVILEDAPFQMDEHALFHLINLTKEQRGHLLITARDYPAQWDIRLPDLATRLRAAELAELAAPDDALLRAVLVKLFDDRQLRVGVDLLEYMITRMERSGAAARLLVERLDRASLERKAPVTRALIREIIAMSEPESQHRT